MSSTPAHSLAVETICFAVPLLPGMTDNDRAAMLSCWKGDRREDHASSRQRHGITRESVWIQSSPIGDVAIVLLQAGDLAAALEGLASSPSAFDQWFRDHVAAVHGINLADGIALPEQVLDYQALDHQVPDYQALDYRALDYRA
jgi:hypothetical protein